MQYRVLANATLTAANVSADKKSLMLGNVTTAFLQDDAPFFALVYTTSTLSGNNIVYAFSTENFSAYMSMTATGKKAAKNAFGGVAFDSSANAIFSISSEISATFADVPYTVLILGGGSW